jgi:hypothetical protein
VLLRGATVATLETRAIGRPWRPCDRGVRAALATCEIVATWASLSSCAKVRFGQVRSGQVRLGQVRLGLVRLGWVGLGWVRFGLVRLGKFSVIHLSALCVVRVFVAATVCQC